MIPPATHDMTGKVALVTGGAKRVGAMIALALADAGMDVAITYRHSKDEAVQTVAVIEAMGRRAMAIAVDFAERDAADVVFDAFTQQFDRLDALVNNASDFEPAPIGQVTLEDFDTNIAVNARSPLMLIQKFAPMLAAYAVVDDDTPAESRAPVESAGRIVNFIDIHVMGQPLKGYIAYNAAKAALMEITMTAALELAPMITVNAIAPGVVSWAPSYTPQQQAQYMQRVPLGRPGTPEDAAKAVLFLVRDADYCTGQIIRLDGGRLWT